LHRLQQLLKRLSPARRSASREGPRALQRPVQHQELSSPRTPGMAGRIISIVNRKGGVGKTTLAIGIADAFVSEHRADVCIVDLDPQSTASQALLGGDEFAARVYNDRNLHGLLRARLRGEDPDVKDYRRGMLQFIKARADVELSLYPNSDRLWDLEASEIRKDGGTRLLAAIKRILNEEAAAGRIVLVDCPPGQSVSALAAIRCSDMVLCPITPDRYALWGMNLLHSYIRANAPDIRPKFIKFVVTRATLVGSEARLVLKRLFGAPEMLRVVTGGMTRGAPDGLALFSERQTVRARIHMQRESTLGGIYGSKCSAELTHIVNAIRRELEQRG
jgi:chromosome partitioning protein